MDNKFQSSIVNDIAAITTINNQTVIITKCTVSTDENSYTSLGAAIGTGQTSKDLNNLLNEATKQSHQNMPHQVPNFQGLEQAKTLEIESVCSTPQPTQTIPSNPTPERRSPKQSYTKPHSTTRTASQSQQNLIQNLCKEKDKDLDTILAPYHRELSAITSAEANDIIQKMTNKNYN